MTQDATKHTTGMTDLWATFYLGKEIMAVPVEGIQEVLMSQPLTPVPLAPSYIAGLLNLRGELISTIDLRTRFKVHSDASRTSQILLVLKHLDHHVSVIVDDIGDVLELPASRWQPPPDTIAKQYRAFVSGICPLDGKMVLGLHIDSLGSANALREDTES